MRAWQPLGLPADTIDISGARLPFATVVAALKSDGTLLSSNDHSSPAWGDWDPSEPPEPDTRATGIAVWSRDDDHLETAIVLDRIRVMHRWVVGGADASGWHAMETPTASVHRLIGVSGGGGRGQSFPELHLIGDGKLWSRSWSGDRGWADWALEWQVGRGGVDAAPEDISAWGGPDGRQHVVVTLADGTVLQRLHGLREPSTSWEILASGTPVGPVVGTAGEGGAQTLFALDSDGELRSRRWRGGQTWGGWERFEPRLPAAQQTRDDLERDSTTDPAPDADQPEPSPTYVDEAFASSGEDVPTEALEPPTMRLEDRGAEGPRAQSRAADGGGTIILPQANYVPLTDADPEQIGKYQLKYGITGGNDGTVKFVARHQSTGVFLKAAHIETHPDHARAILASGALARELPASEFLPPVLEADQADGYAFVAQRLVTGEGLDASLRSAGGGGLELREALSVSLDLARGIQLFATHGLVHRDVKPANIIRSDTGHACLVDYGSVCQSHVELVHPVSYTPEYSGPEVDEFAMAHPGNDVWSWALVTIQMLTGRRVQPKMHETGGKAYDYFARLHDLDDSLIPRSVRRLLNEALRVDPDERPNASRIIETLAIELDREPEIPRLQAFGDSASALPSRAEEEWRRFLVTVGNQGLFVYRGLLLIIAAVSFLAGLIAAVIVIG
ncbi:protein kinase domain-containing protein [Nocardioides ultimimeridianus]